MNWEEMAPSEEIEAAEWIGGRLHPFGQDVGSVVPTGFEAYARIFHPASRLAGREQVEVRWSDVAEWSGRTVHPEMQFHTIAVPLPDRDTRLQAWSYEPWLGALSERQARALVTLLARYTSTPNVCWFCVWAGYGFFNTSAVQWLSADSGVASHLQAWWWRVRVNFQRRKPVPQKGKLVRLPARDYLLFKGPLALALGHRDGPNLWWPDDRSWCVASEIDFPYTYVGGPKKLIDEILAEPSLEALPAALDHGITAFSDTVNTEGFVGLEE
jgi:hypothetical protein